MLATAIIKSNKIHRNITAMAQRFKVMLSSYFQCFDQHIVWYLIWKKIKKILSGTLKLASIYQKDKYKQQLNAKVKA